MSFQAYLDTVKEQTGKTVADFKMLAAEKGLSKHGEVVAWLRQDFGLGHGHATAVACPCPSPKSCLSQATTSPCLLSPFSAASVLKSATVLPVCSFTVSRYA